MRGYISFSEGMGKKRDPRPPRRSFMHCRSGKRTERKIPPAPATAIAEQSLMVRRTIGHGDITPEDMNLGGDKK